MSNNTTVCWWCGMEYRKESIHKCSLWQRYAEEKTNFISFIPKCPTCDSKVDINKQFCPDCGTKLIPFGGWIIRQIQKQNK